MVSKLYRTFFGRIVDLYSAGVIIIFDVDGKLNTNLSSHGGKKHMLQSLSDSGNNPVATVFRAGSTLKKMHILFDYVFRSTSMDIETGLHISGWSNPLGSCPKNDGLSPLIDDALNVGSKEQRTTERTLIEAFCKQLFYRSKLGDEFHHLLLASVFKHWQAMVNTCTVNLRLKTHRVVDYVNQVLSVCNIPRQVFDKWCSNTILAFKLKNISALDYDEIKDLPEGATVDVRNFMDQQERLTNMVNHTNQKLVTALGTVTQIRDAQLKDQTQRDRMEARQDKIDAKQDSIEAKLDIILSFHHLKVPEANSASQLSTDGSVLNQSSIQPPTSST